MSKDTTKKPTTDKQTILVTGAAGFIGNYVCREFFQAGWRVIGTDCSNEENAPLDSVHQYIQLELPTQHLVKTIAEEQPSVCVHCAGRASVAFSMRQPHKDFLTNTVLTYELLDSIRWHAPKCSFIFLSSAAVYGAPKQNPISESCQPEPISPYGYHKWQSELICQEFAQVHDVKTASMRVFSAYGPGLRRQVIWDLCRKAFSEREVILQGTGIESRDFIHGRDIARAVVAIASEAPMEGESYNVAGGEETTIRDLAKWILNSVGIKKKIQFEGHLPKGTPSQWRADINKLNALGYKSGVAFQDGVKEFVQWSRPFFTT